MRSVQNPGHVTPIRQLKGPRCALRDELTDTRKSIFIALPSLPQGALPPLDAWMTLSTVSPHGARRLGVVIAQSVRNVQGSSG
jgi:hypothetical protein